MVTGRVVVVGGGISGLAAAHELRRLRPELDVTVLEGADHVGGKLRRVEVGGALRDVGAESLLNRRPEAVELARAVGLAHAVCHPATSAAQVWTRGRLRVLPPTVLGIPTDLRELQASGIVPPAGVAEAVVRSRVPHRPPQDDVSVGHVVSRMLGRPVLDRLVEPLLGGVYAGHADELSLAAAAPQIAELVRQSGSPVAAAAATRAVADDKTPVFAGLVGGVGQLPDAVAAASGAVVRTGATVRSLRRREAGWDLVVGPTRAEEVVQVDAVVLATPAAPTAKLLGRVAPAAAAALRAVDYASMAVVTLVLPSSAVGPRMAGSGFLVPPVDGRVVKAATFSSSKWAWVGADEHVVLRASIGRHREEAVLQRSDTELVDLAMGDLADAVGVRGPLVDAHVQRWGGALPQYAVGHLERVGRALAAVADVPRLEVCGAAYHGVGIAACVADGQRGARSLIADLPPPQPRRSEP